MKEDKTTLKRLKLLPVLFRKQDAEKVSQHPSVFLSRAQKYGFIHRLNRGNYINSFLYGFPAIEEVAGFLRPPSYISCEWALNLHGILLQSPRVCSVITLSGAVGKNRGIQYQDILIEFSRISGNLFFGFKYSNKYYIATPEKALLDTIYFRKAPPAPDELELENLNIDYLFKIVEKYPSRVLKYLQYLTNICKNTPSLARG